MSSFCAPHIPLPTSLSFHSTTLIKTSLPSPPLIPAVNRSTASVTIGYTASVASTNLTALNTKLSKGVNALTTYLRKNGYPGVTAQATVTATFPPSSAPTSDPTTSTGTTAFLTSDTSLLSVCSTLPFLHSPHSTLCCSLLHDLSRLPAIIFLPSMLFANHDCSSSLLITMASIFIPDLC